MDPMTTIGVGLLGGSALGLGKGLLDQGKEARDRQLQAQIMRYSPWTGMKPQPVQQADTTGSVLQGGITGAMMGQSYGNMQNQQALNDSMKNYYASQTPQGGSAGALGGSSPWLNMGQQPGYPGGASYPARY